NSNDKYIETLPTSDINKYNLKLLKPLENIYTKFEQYNQKAITYTLNSDTNKVSRTPYSLSTFHLYPFYSSLVLPLTLSLQGTPGQAVSFAKINYSSTHVQLLTAIESFIQQSRQFAVDLLAK